MTTMISIATRKKAQTVPAISEIKFNSMLKLFDGLEDTRSIDSKIGVMNLFDEVGGSNSGIRDNLKTSSPE